MPIVKLNTDFINNNLHCPEGKRRIEYCDKSLPGFLVEVSNASPGIGSYRLRYKDDAGATRYVSLGRTNVVDLAEARKKAKALKAEIALGSDPRAEDKARKAVPTLTEVKAEGKSESTCNHYVKMLRHALNLAVDWGMLEKNPAARVPLFREDNQVEHYMDKEQLDRLLSVLRTDENRPACLIAMFLLSTGARLNEALTAQWQYVDREHRVWRIPSISSKSKKVRSVPLNDSAIEVLDQLDTEKSFEHLFINRKTGKPYTTIYKIWTRLRKDAGLPHLRIHDLRHQYAPFLVNSGRTLYEVQQILGHSVPTVTQRYAHLSTRSLQDAANSASDIINGAVGGSA